ncbi:MAG TPA: nucleotidyltransferase domain-containing protein [Syntrophaceae bacterium]|nr:nucleotidyltransferase domain-containing protein [Syntrophaceae bacterium]
MPWINWMIKVLPVSRVKEILQRKEQRKARLQASLDSIVNQLKGIGALKIILFGSLARGEVDINSDLDLLVLMPSTKTGKEWMNIIYDTIERRIASNIMVYNQKEFHDKLPTSSFLQNISKGKVVYEKVA